MAENADLKITGGEGIADNGGSPPTKKRSGSFKLSPARESPGSNSSSPRVGRASTGPSLSSHHKSKSLSKDTLTVEDDSAGNMSGTVSDSEKLGSSGSGRLKKKHKDKKFFGVSSIMNIFSAPHHHKHHEMHKIFSSLPISEKLVDDYSCALQRDILIHGRLYVTQSWLCFYANIFSWETLITIPFKSVRAITKEKTVLVIPNAIQITVSNDKYGFTSLVNRDVTYTIIFKCWQNNLLDQPMSPLELVKAARKAHGESTDVGTEADLWGSELKKGDKKSLNKQVSMPTYVEIGRIPPNSSNSSTSTTNVDGAASTSSLHAQSLPAGMLNGAAEPAMDSSLARGAPNTLELATSDSKKGVAQDERSSKTPPINIETPSSSDGRTVVAADPEKGSIGGESGTEYETVSLIEETGEIFCNCSEHIGRTILNDVYNTDVETIFKLLFTDSDFLRNFNKAEKTINVDTGEWQVQPDSSRLRDLSYTVALNYSFGPKFTHTTEHQVYSKSGQPGLKHIVDTEVVNHNIPYGDTFFTVCRYCVTRVAHRKTRLRVTANIKFKKSCWGLVKNLIERNAGDGLRTHYTHLDTVLKEHVASLKDKQSRAHRRASRPSVTTSRRHKRQAPAAKPTPVATPVFEVPEMNGRSRDASPFGARTESMRPSTPSAAEKTATDDEGIQETQKRDTQSLPRMNLALTLLLGVLIISNMLLYQHLMSYTTNPEVAIPNAPPPPVAPIDNLYSKNDFKSNIEWPITISKEEMQAFLQQELAIARNKETGQLKEALFSFIQALDNIENSINEAKLELLSTLNGWNPKMAPSPSDADKEMSNGGATPESAQATPSIDPPTWDGRAGNPRESGPPTDRSTNPKNQNSATPTEPRGPPDMANPGSPQGLPNTPQSGGDKTSARHAKNLTPQPTSHEYPKEL